VLYVATARLDEDRDLEQRVREHQARRPQEWETFEAGDDLDSVLQGAAGHRVLLVDSLTLWVAGRMEGGFQQTFDAFEKFLEKAGEIEAPVILVSDEVGLGVVPESAEGREFRDLLGLVNQRAAVAAREVYLCVAGIEVRVK
jgi:adenosylcobinamide kinase/adenosylcobinamide-phosphate guanylyltransferase